MNTQAINPRMFVGFVLNVTSYAETVRARLGTNAQYVDLPETVRQMIQMYFYSEMLPSIKPTDTYLGAVAVYTVNQSLLPNEVRGHVLTVLSETQWDLHDYINQSIQYVLGANVCRESEYYYQLGPMGKMMVYVPLMDGLQGTYSSYPEAAVVYACYSTLPEAKRLAFGALCVNGAVSHNQSAAF